MNKNPIILVNFICLRGGALSYAYEMVRALSLREAEVFVLLSKEMYSIEEWRKIINVTLIEIDGYSTRLNFFPRLIKFIFTGKKIVRKAVGNRPIDIIYLTHTSFWAWIINRLIKSKVNIYTFHDPIPHNLKRSFSTWASRDCAKFADGIIILSDCFREYICKEYNLPDNHVLKVSFGNQKYYVPAGNNRQHETGTTFLFYGRIDQYKGVDILYNAYMKIRENYQNVRLRIAGKGPLAEYIDLTKKYEDVNIINRYIDDSEVAGLFQGERVITVLPYRSATQSGVAPIAFDLNSLVISTNVGGLAEQVIPGETGIVVEPDSVSAISDAMEYALMHKDDCERMVKNAKKMIGAESWEQQAEKVYDFAMRILMEKK